MLFKVFVFCVPVHVLFKSSVVMDTIVGRSLSDTGKIQQTWGESPNQTLLDNSVCVCVWPCACDPLLPDMRVWCGWDNTASFRTD